MKTDEPASTADENSAPREASRAPAPPAGSLAATGPAGHRAARQDEAVALLHLATRLKAAYPSVDPSVVDEVVTTARGSFQQAKVRTYVPILVERRVRALLGAQHDDGTTHAPSAVGDATAERPAPAGTAERRAESPGRPSLLGRWIPARLRPAPASDLGGVGERS
ncbi:three-helix bundle dimerization domain-containing protein [Streptomyces sp. NPDC002742]|uniref:three-helix bundle dimerization domain-containing protein n=1 Tax=Streptomyces sp. NPDC002742 TaxID=3364663 RepID=UPI00368E411B